MDVSLSFSELPQEPGGATAEATGHPSRARTGFDRGSGAGGEYWHPRRRTGNTQRQMGTSQRTGKAMQINYTFARTNEYRQIAGSLQYS